MAQNELIKVEEFTNILQTAPGSLAKNQNSVARCNDAGKTLLDTIEANGGIDSDKLDTSVADFINKAKITVKKMNERRSPLTQLLTRIAKEFTTLENEINITNKDSIPARLQAYRDKYAAKKLAEQKAREEAERKRQAAENEKSEYRINLSLSIEKHYSRYFEDYSEKLTRLFSEINLQNFEQNASRIEQFSTVYPAREHFSKFLDLFNSVYLTKEDRQAIKQEIIPDLMQSCVKRYAEDMQNIKDDLILKLSSRKRELERIEKLKKQDADAAARAEAAAKEREAEAERTREAERKQRESEEKTRLEAQAAQADMFSAFSQTAAEIPTSIPDAKVTKKIKVNNAKGFLDVYQMWFLGEGASLSIEELEKVHKKMITFCEKKANKDKEFLNSVFIEYVDDVKAK